MIIEKLCHQYRSYGKYEIYIVISCRSVNKILDHIISEIFYNIYKMTLPSHILFFILNPD